MNVLVSGSSGFIGRALVARLEARGDTVHRLERARPSSGRAAPETPASGSRDPSERHPGSAVIDLTTRRIDTAALPGGSLESIDAVFHLSGEPITPWRWTAAKRERIRASRVATTHAVARSIADAPGPRPVLVSMSAVGFYGERGEEILDETSAGGSGTLAEICRAWEEASAPARDAGARVVNLRSGVVLGPGGGSLRIQLPLFRAGLGGRLGTGRQWTSWISLEDEVGALLQAADDPELSGPCNATSPEPVRNAELTAALAAIVHRPALLSMPRPLLGLIAGQETTREVLCVSQRVLPGKLERSGYQFVHGALEGALAAAVAPTRAGPGEIEGVVRA
ncbi:MAG: Epimerase family protein [Acidimicrobiaceae bacterium]|nr:Epimerase family protein [Acidimicrobiaceae bacterium]